MPSSLAPSSLRPGDHACSWYSTDGHRDAVAAPFVSAGLRARERVLYLHAESSPASVLDMIRRDGTDTDSALAAGSLTVRSAIEMYRPDGRFDGERMLERLADEADGARRDGFSGLRLAAEMSWAATGDDDLGDYEHRANDVFDRTALTAVCLYDRRRFTVDSPSPGGAHGLHVWPEPPRYGLAMAITIAETNEPYGVRLEGEVDFATSLVLADALTRIVDGADGDVHVDLSGLRFIDVGAARLLARAARQLGTSGALVLESPSRAVHRLLKVLDGRIMAGFVVRGREGDCP